jgi:outer membrane protein assembly factor BamB
MTFKKFTAKLEFSVALFAFSAALFLGSLIVFAVLLRGSHLLPHTAGASVSYQSWQVFDGGKDDPGANYGEGNLTTGNVSGLRLLWQASTPAAADDSVVYQANVDVNGAYENLAFLNTIKGNLIAYNALTGAKVWEADPSSADFNGQGTKSSPAVDPSGKYVYAYADDGYVHRYNIATGSEATGGGFPAQVTLLPNNVEKGSSSINIGNGYLYMTTSGNDGDYGHYVGHVIAVNLSSGAETVWNSECSNITTLETNNSGAGNYCSNAMSGIWARPGVKIDPVTGNVFVATGNGNYNASSGGNNWGDSIVELTPNLSSIVDSYTPSNYASLDSSDLDLGSSAPVLLPTQSGSNTPYMLVQGGKDSTIRLINRSNMSGQGGPGHTGGELHSYGISNQMHNEPAVWQDGSGNTWVYVTDDSGDLYAYKVVTSGGNSSLSEAYTRNVGVSSSPFVANGVLYFSGNNILALNATTGATLFNSSSIGVSLTQHWEAPVIVNGALYTPDDNGHIYALYLPGVTPTSAPAGPGSSPSPSPSGGSSSGGSSSSKPSTGSTATKSPTAAAATSAAPTPQQAATMLKNATEPITVAGDSSLTLLVTTPQGKPAVNAKVMLNNGDVAYTNTAGKVEFDNLKPGSYTAKVEVSGAKPYSVPVSLSAGQARDVSIKLVSASSAMFAIYTAVVVVVVAAGLGFGHIWFFRLPIHLPKMPWSKGGGPTPPMAPPTVISPQ